MGMRRPGDPLSGEFIRACRTRAGLTQDEFAAALGLHGGKGVISGWEVGRTTCEGPTAELVLDRYGAGERITGMQHATLGEEERSLYEQFPHDDVYVRSRPAVS